MKPLCTYKSNNIMQKRLAIDASRLEFGGNQAPANYNQPLCYQGFWRVGIYFIFKYPLKYPHQGFLHLPFGYYLVLCK